MKRRFYCEALSEEDPALQADYLEIVLHKEGIDINIQVPPGDVPAIHLKKDSVEKLHDALRLVKEKLSDVSTENNTCEACRFENPVGGVRNYGYSVDAHLDKGCQRHKTLCDFCASTYVGATVEVYQPNQEIYNTIAYGVNLILTTLNKTNGDRSR